LADVPDVRELKRANPETTAFIRLAEDRARSKGRNLVVRKAWVPLDRISPHLVHAVLVSEDGSFYRHRGVDYEAFQAALDRNLELGRMAYGASTLTQQLAKNLYLSPSRNPLRKLKEALIAFRLEKELGKRRILELYLNLAEWGEGVYGAQAASLAYFGKSAWDLSPEEAVGLATALPNPRRYLPARHSRYLDRTRRLVLHRLVQAGYLREDPAVVPAPVVDVSSGPVEAILPIPSTGPEAPSD